MPTVFPCFSNRPGSPVRQRDNELASTKWWWPGRPVPQRWSRVSRPKTHDDYDMTTTWLRQTTTWLRHDYDMTTTWLRLVWLVTSWHILSQKWMNIMKSPQKNDSLYLRLCQSCSSDFWPQTPAQLTPARNCSKHASINKYKIVFKWRNIIWSHGMAVFLWIEPLLCFLETWNT